jgi:para-nitrobenzyl esterase
VRPTVLAVVLLAACSGRAPERPAPDTALRRSTTSGDVVGFVGRYGSAVWLGVPYAAPPVGARRWRAPSPPARWDGVREAVTAGAPCVQYTSPYGGVDGAARGTAVGEEDCLSLNLYAPRDAAPRSSRLPVMVWIHGGGNTVGYAGRYDGGNLAATEDVLVVVINYRLGPFGWFRHAALRNAGTSDLERSGNFGTLDHVRALEWVRDNAAAFGGDPGNVTVFGEGAGGTNVLALLVAPSARGLFHRAIVQSGGLGFDPPASAEGFADDPAPSDGNSSGEALVRLLRAEGAAGDRVAAKARLAAMSPEEVASYLRARPAFDLLRAFPTSNGSGLIDMPLVFRDGTVLPAGEPLAALTRGDAHVRVPVILGTTRDENKLFMFDDPTLVRRWFWLVPRLRDSASYQIRAEYLARMWKATGADEPAAALDASQAEPVFVYRFDWDEEPTLLGTDLSMMLGAAHAFEIPFVFGHFDLGGDGSVVFTSSNAPGRQALSAQMMSYWAQFARAGDPGGGGHGALPAWLPWDGWPRFMVFDTPAGGGPHLSSDGVTRTTLLAAVDADPRLPTQRDKCRIFRSLARSPARWSRGLMREEYPTAGARGCREYPFDGASWAD